MCHVLRPQLEIDRAACGVVWGAITLIQPMAAWCANGIDF